MHVNRRFQFIAVVVIWISLVLIVLVATRAFSLEQFFIFSFISYLAAVELMTPGSITLSWSKRLRLLSQLGLVVMVGIIARRALETLPESLLP